VPVGEIGSALLSCRFAVRRLGAMRGSALTGSLTVRDVMQRHLWASAVIIVQFFQFFVAEILDRGEFVLGTLHPQPSSDSLRCEAVVSRFCVF
jgi:hypothetical protein